jgi:hypothetical protein
VLPLRPRAPSTEPAIPVPPGRAGLTRVTSDILHAGATLQDALEQPEGTLREAVRYALELLDGAVRDMRSATFAGPGHNDAGTPRDDAVVPSGLHCRDLWP